MTNHIYGSYGVYDCSEGLMKRGLTFAGNGTPYAANHFRAILDLLYDWLIEDLYPFSMQCASEDYLDTEEEKSLLLEKAELMFPHLSAERQNFIHKWLENERLPGYRA
jgi:hypothetical protein